MPDAGNFLDDPAGAAPAEGVYGAIQPLLDAIRLGGGMFGDVGIGVAIAGRDGTLRWANRLLSELSPARPLRPGDSCREVLCAGTCETCPIEASAGQGRVARTLKIPGPDPAAPRYFHLVCLPLRADVPTTEVAVFLLEFTEQEHLARRARSQEQFILHIANNAAEAILILDPEGRILFWSHGAEATFGYTAEEVMGRPYAILVPPDLLEAGEQDDVAARIRQQGFLRGYETVRMARDGRRIPVSVTVTSVRGGDGQEEGRSVVLQDISEKKRDYLRQRLAVSRLALLNEIGNLIHGSVAAEDVLELILVGVTAGQGLGFNRAFLLLVDDERQALRGEVALGPAGAEEAGRIWQALAREPLDLQQALERYRGQAHRGDHPVNRIARSLWVPLTQTDHMLIRALREQRGVRAGPGSQDGPVPPGLAETLQVDALAAAPLLARGRSVGVLLADNAITGAPISDEDLELLRLFAGHAGTALENSRLYRELSQKVTELAEAHASLRENQQRLLELERLSAVGEMAAKVAHEIRTPLVSIGGFARQVARALPEGHADQRFLQIIQEEVLRLEGIVTEILDFVRRPSGDYRRGDVNELVEETARRSRVALQARGVGLRVHAAPALPRIPMNRDRVLQVLLNLVQNAAQAMSGRGEVEIHTEGVEGWVHIHVDDRGPGVPRDLEEKIYRPFFSTKESGSGLGLAIATQIAEQHQGRLRHREREGGGTRFTLELPVPRGRGPAEEAEDAHDPDR